MASGRSGRMPRAGRARFAVANSDPPPPSRLARAVSSRLVVIQSDDVVLDCSGATSMTKSSLATAHSTSGGCLFCELTLSVQHFRL